MPPYLREVEPSACWNASKMICCLSAEMPMPVSLTEKATTWWPGSAPRCRATSRWRRAIEARPRRGG